MIQDVRKFDGAIDLLLSHVEMPGVPNLTGPELAQRLNQERPDTKIFLLSGKDSGMLVLNHGWQFQPTLHKLGTLQARIQHILKQPQGSEKHQDAEHRRVALTKKETQVLRLIADGNSTKQVAAILGMAYKTCVGHRHRLMKKLGIHDSVSLIRYAIRAGLVEA